MWYIWYKLYYNCYKAIINKNKSHTSIYQLILAQISILLSDRNDDVLYNIYVSAQQLHDYDDDDDNDDSDNDDDDVLDNILCQRSAIACSATFTSLTSRVT